MSQVNIIDPVSPAATQALGNVGDLLMSQAELAARSAMARAQIDSQERIEEARLKSAAELQKVQQEGFKDYQGFQASEAEKERGFQQQRDLEAFEQTKQLNAQAAAIEQKRVDDLNNMQIRLKQMDLKRIKSTKEEQGKLDAERATLAKQAAEAEAELMAASVLFGTAPGEYQGVIDRVSTQVEDLATGLGTTKQAGSDFAASAIARAASLAGVEPKMLGMGKKTVARIAGFLSGGAVGAVVAGATTGTGSDLSEKGFVRNLVQEVDAVLTNDGKLEQGDREKLKRAMYLLAETDGQANPDPASADRNMEEAGALLQEIAAKDPTMGVLIDSVLTNLGSHADEMEAESRTTEALADAQGQRSGMLGRAFGSDLPDTDKLTAISQNAGRVGRRIRDNYRATGFKPLDDKMLALAVGKLHDLANAYRTGSEAQEEVKGLPPTVQKLILEHYGDVEKAAGKLKKTQEREKELVRKKADVSTKLDALDSMMGSKSRVEDEQIDELEKMLR